MEKLKSLVPKNLKETIAKGRIDDLHSTCSSLVHFFQHLPQFHQLVGDLTTPDIALCKKDNNAAVELKLKGNHCFSNGDYAAAAHFYSQALRMAPSNIDDTDKDILATLYVNRAASFHKMYLLKECLRDCRRAIAKSPYHSKAWFRRGRANADLENYEDAIRDFQICLELEMSSSGKRQIERELRSILQQCKGKQVSAENIDLNSSDSINEAVQVKLHRVSISRKGQGIVSSEDIAESSLIHIEDPYAAIVLKHCRETHCHFCFNELPPDNIPCPSCTIPLYCSEKCQWQAGGMVMDNIQINDIMHGRLSDDFEHYISTAISISSCSSTSDHFAEHKHECFGVHWPAVLPADIVLAGRILVKYLDQHKCNRNASHLMENLKLCHNYAHLPSESRLEFHIYSIILVYCLRHGWCSRLPLPEDSTSQLVLILSQIRVNSIAVVRMKVVDANGHLVQLSNFSEEALTNTVEQVRVGQAIYLKGSLFNHSCIPNAHAYFLSRSLCIRATEFVPAGCQVEISYGSQVGRQNCPDRQKFLQDHYAFICQCAGCSGLNLPDLVISGYRCAKPNCSGVVLENLTAKYEKPKLNCFLAVSPNRQIQGNELSTDGTEALAHHVYKQIGKINQFEPGFCSNCFSFLDMEAASSDVSKAENYFERLQDALASDKVSSNILSGGVKHILLLRKHLHPFNKRIAEAEDTLAQAYSSAGKLKEALYHCKLSIQILEKLYNSNHIVIGNEVLKLASIQKSIEESSAAESIRRVTAILLRYYGSHMHLVYPHVRFLGREVNSLTEVVKWVSQFME